MTFVVANQNFSVNVNGHDRYFQAWVSLIDTTDLLYAGLEDHFSPVPPPSSESAESPLTLTAHTFDEVALTLTPADTQNILFLAHGTAAGEVILIGGHADIQMRSDNSTSRLKLKRLDDWEVFTVGGSGDILISPFEDATAVSVYAAPDQTADLLNVFDKNSNLVFQIEADGTTHIKTGTTIQADL